MENITDAGYKHTKRVWEDFEMQSLVEFHDLYIQSNTLPLEHVFESFRSKCLRISEIDPACFLLAPELAWQAYLKRTGVELELVADVDMLLMVEKGIGDRMCNVVHWYAKSNRRYMKQACDFSGFLQENLFLSFTYKRGQSQRGGLIIYICFIK